MLPTSKRKNWERKWFEDLQSNEHKRHTNFQWPNNTNEHTWSLVHTHVTQPHKGTLKTETSIYFHVLVYLAWFTHTSLSANFSSFIDIAQVYCSTSKDGESSLKTGLKLCWSAVTSWLIQFSGDIADLSRWGPFCQNNSAEMLYRDEWFNGHQMVNGSQCLSEQPYLRWLQHARLIALHEYDKIPIGWGSFSLSVSLSWWFIAKFIFLWVLTNILI